ncbi:hypothetical protein NADFUDRAFT_83140 [Nadsonia fulvescens var. elongata DSM 6958]|uniref:Autophagy-related protein 101 n=1 Tax=Nadsonia fulvescens var. elongata DSM 6958 TaxID=857566 RepID=A0A1E3PIA0_9ASCO|nr:hypothetical protein NADFUDRAFT_83140 [Nadsonia fulvescens var. elongata DSM 6958]
MQVKYDIQVPPILAHDLLKAVLSAIFFHRLFGSIQPQVRHFGNLDYPSPVSPTVDTLIEEQVSQLLRTIQSQTSSPSLSTISIESPHSESSSFGSIPSLVSSSYSSTSSLSSSSSGSGQTGQIAIQFFQRSGNTTVSSTSSSAWVVTPRKPAGDDSHQTCWEQWIVNITLRPQTPNGGTEDRQLAEKDLSRILLDMVNFTNDHKDHIPPITTTDDTPFPYRVVIKTAETAKMGKALT